MKRGKKNTQRLTKKVSYGDGTGVSGFTDSLLQDVVLGIKGDGASRINDPPTNMHSNVYFKDVVGFEHCRISGIWIVMGGDIVQRASNWKRNTYPSKKIQKRNKLVGGLDECI